MAGFHLRKILLCFKLTFLKRFNIYMRTRLKFCIDPSIEKFYFWLKKIPLCLKGPNFFSVVL